MSALKSPLTLPLPRRADRTRAPTAAAAVLAMLVVLQLGLPGSEELPGDGGVVAPLRLRVQQPVPAVGDKIVVARALFAPNRRNDLVVAGSAPGEKTGPLSGALPVGVTSARGVTRVFLQAPDGSVRTLVRGANYRGWRLTRILPGAVVFTRGSDTLSLSLAASLPPVPKPATEPPEEEEQQ